MRTLGLVLILAGLALPVRAAWAEDDCGAPQRCAGCGRHVACQQKVCRLVCGMEKVKKSYWSVQCDEFCPLMPGCGAHSPCCALCGPNCRGACCQKCGDCCKTLASPRCGRPKCVKRLVKKEYEVDTPKYKCVVKYLCSDCCQAEPIHAQAKPATSIPAPPRVPQTPKIPTSARRRAAGEPVPLPPL